MDQHPALYIDALQELAKWQEEQGLAHLTVVESLERQLYGANSLAVARTLKAIGTVHLVLEAFADAEQCLGAAMTIFEANQSHAHLVEDIRVKLQHIENVRADARGR